MDPINAQRVVEELAAIGFARATNFLCVQDDVLTIRSTEELSEDDQAAIASIERTSNGLRVKFYDKMKALELLGKYMGLFDGKQPRQTKDNHLLEAIMAATQEEMDTHDIPEIQHAAVADHDLGEPTGP